MGKTPKKSSTRQRWSAEVTKRSDALDLEPDVFKSKDPRKIALSLKRSAEQSTRRKGTPYQSAMSMLNFYINTAPGKIFPKNKSAFLSAQRTSCATSLAETSAALTSLHAGTNDAFVVRTARSEFGELFRMQDSSEDFQAINNARPRSGKVSAGVHQINFTVPCRRK